MDAKGKAAAALAKGQQQGKAPDAYGKGPATHDQRGGGGDLRCLWQGYNPEMPYNVFMRNLSLSLSHNQLLRSLNQPRLRGLHNQPRLTSFHNHYFIIYIYF